MARFCVANVKRASSWVRDLAYSCYSDFVASESLKAAATATLPSVLGLGGSPGRSNILVNQELS